MVDAKISLKKGFYAGIASFIPTILLLLSISECIALCLPQDIIIYGSVSVGIVSGAIKAISDAIKHWND
jgi:hypothetical protein